MHTDRQAAWSNAVDYWATFIRLWPKVEHKMWQMSILNDIMQKWIMHRLEHE